MGDATTHRSRLIRERLAALACGIVVAFILLEVLLRLGGWAFHAQHQRRAVRAMQREGSIDILCIGESTTAMGGDGSYPAQLERILNERSGSSTFRVVNGGVPGVDSSVLIARLDEALRSYEPDIVVAMMGANDDHNSRTGALPLDELPAAQRTGLPYSLKTYKLVRQLHHDLVVGPATQDTTRRTPLTLQERVSRPSCDPEQGDGESKESCPGISRAWDHFTAGEFQDAEARFAELRAQFPDDPAVLLEAAVYEKRRGRLREAEKALARASELDPSSPEILLEIADVGVRDQLGHPHEIDRLRDILPLIPDDPRPHLLMARHLRADERLEALLVALELEPDLEQTRVQVAATYRELGRSELAEEHLLEALRRRDPAEPACMACVFLFAGELPAARLEELDALVALHLDARSEDDIVLAMCADYYRKRGFLDHAAELDEKAARLRESTVHPMLRDNYHLLWEELSARGIHLVAVQYPRLPVAPLEQLFASEPGPIIVDNRAVFSRALEQHAYSELFIDRGYGTFGHATALGNQLIAENIAAAILGDLGLR